MSNWKPHPLLGVAHVDGRALPVGEILDTLDTIIEAHLAVTRAGYVAVDFYDGCVLCDFAQRTTHLCDLDLYRAARSGWTEIDSGVRRATWRLKSSSAGRSSTNEPQCSTSAAQHSSFLGRRLVERRSATVGVALRFTGSPSGP